MKKLTKIAATAALSILLPAMAGVAYADGVSGAVVKSAHSGGLQGGQGCLYIEYTFNVDGKQVPGQVTLPLNASPNTPQLVAAMNVLTHPTISFNFGAPNAAVCSQAGWDSAPTMLFPGSP